MQYISEEDQDSDNESASEYVLEESEDEDSHGYKIYTVKPRKSWEKHMEDLNPVMPATRSQKMTTMTRKETSGHTQVPLLSTRTRAKAVRDDFQARKSTVSPSTSQPPVTTRPE